jgi:hypothetical protein
MNPRANVLAVPFEEAICDDLFSLTVWSRRTSNKDDLIRWELGIGRNSPG